MQAMSWRPINVLLGTVVLTCSKHSSKVLFKFPLFVRYGSALVPTSSQPRKEASKLR